MGRRRLTKEDREYDALFPVYHYQDLLRLKLRPEHHLAGHGWFKRGAGTNLVGPTGTGKSVLLLQYAACLATGTPILGLIPVPRPEVVVYLEAENDEEILRRDLLSIADNLKLNKQMLTRNLHIRHVYGVTNKTFAETFSYHVERYCPGAIFVDPYQDYVDGDINKAEVFREWVRPLDRIIKAKGVAMGLGVHTGKPRDVSGWDTRALAYLGAGTSAMANWARVSCELFACTSDVRRFRLHFSKGAEYTTLRMPQTDVALRDLYVEHSKSALQPWWAVCQDQSGDIVRVDYEKKVQETAAAHPTWSMRKIAQDIHCSVGMVSRYYPEKLRKGRKTEKVGKS